MKGRQSRYVTGGESFAEIARLPSGAVVRLCLNTGLEDALREASKSLKSAFTRSGRKCRLSAGLAGAVSMAFGTVLTRKWQPPVPLLTFTAWQLAAGGLLLVPVALVFDPPIPMPTGTNVLGLAWLGLIGAGLTYFLWFRGISRLEPTVVSLLGFLSPGTAVLLGWLFLDQTLSALQIIGVLLVIGSIWLGQRSNRTPRARIACRKSP